MAYKNIEKLREYRRKWYNQNKTFAKKRVQDRIAETYLWFNKYKSGLKCKICSENDIACLDFHHRNSDDKICNIAYAVRRGWSKDRIMKEVDKCDVLCSNCHRKLHYYGSVG
jgi:hypothetical protein